jgi:hypothetical protein
MFCHCSYEHPTEAIAVSSPCFVGYGATHRRKLRLIPKPGGPNRWKTQPSMAEPRRPFRTCRQLRATAKPCCTPGRAISVSYQRPTLGGSARWLNWSRTGPQSPICHISAAVSDISMTRAGSHRCKIVRCFCRELVLGYDLYPRSFRYAGALRHPHYRRRQG